MKIAKMKISWIKLTEVEYDPMQVERTEQKLKRHNGNIEKQ